jgi:hypothetical protein
MNDLTGKGRLRDSFGKGGGDKPPSTLDPRIAKLIRLLARSAAIRDYKRLLETGEQPITFNPNEIFTS